MKKVFVLVLAAMFLILAVANNHVNASELEEVKIEYETKLENLRAINEEKVEDIEKLILEKEKLEKDLKKLEEKLKEEAEKPLEEEIEEEVEEAPSVGVVNEESSYVEPAYEEPAYVETGGGWSQTMRVSMYTLSYECCGKYPDHPEYGLTASGAYVQEGYTVAAGPSIPFGTRIYIPALEYLNGTGVFVVQDRGGAIGDDCIDVYVGDYSQAVNWGAPWIEVQILD